MSPDTVGLARELEAAVAAVEGVVGLYPPHSALRSVLSAGRSRILATDGEGLVGLREEAGVLVVHVRFAGTSDHPGPSLVRRVAHVVRTTLGERAAGAEVRVQLCAIVAPADLPRVMDAADQD
ncbi:hypothetical protein PTW37_04175 [Arthrobacter agilis]|uniref:hypothetical protein n=1 Tax=Arthrobacter agilis TaxID=37921 RepID=UPI0023667EFD|nr:hypothetical protein [Arthrobacter agilis]WDF34134.1 hypothetical protein PTW37_04175 [Arthrobacter agilis]